jgi:hypothetical protein
MEEGNRRYCMLEVICNESATSEYFKRLNNISPEALGMFLYSRDISKFTRQLPYSTYERTQKQMNLTSGLRFWLDCIESNSPITFDLTYKLELMMKDHKFPELHETESVVIPKDILIAAYEQWHDKPANRRAFQPKSTDIMSVILRSIGQTATERIRMPILADKSRPYGHRIPSIGDLKHIWRETIVKDSKWEFKND